MVAWILRGARDLVGAFLNPGVPVAAKLVVVIATLWVTLPNDLIRDGSPAGFLDDIVVGAVGLQKLVEIYVRHRLLRGRAEQQGERLTQRSG